jgi:hypothetical protein
MTMRRLITDMERYTRTNRAGQTLDNILPQPVLRLVEQAPANPMTRGQVRANTNLAIPEVVNTSEGIEEYVLENYDASKAPNTEVIRRQEAERATVTRRDERIALNAEMDREALFTHECEASEERIYDVSEVHSADYSSRVRFHERTFHGCITRESCISSMRDWAVDIMQNDGCVNEEHRDTYDSEYREAQNWENATDYDQLWEDNKHRIAESLGLSVEEMED